MSYRKRQPKWFREDGNVLAINEDTENVKLHSYHDFERTYTKQPMQIWATFKPKSYTFIGTESIPIDITGSYPSMFNFVFIAEDDITDDITISDGTNTITVHADVTAGSTFELSPQGKVKIDGNELLYIYDQQQPIADRDIPFGVIDGNRKLMQTFTPEVAELSGIEIEFSRLMGAQDGLTIQLYELDDKGNLDTKVEEIQIDNANLQQYTSMFTLTIPFKQTLDITKKYAFTIERHASHSNTEYFVLRGTIDNTGTLKYWDGESWKPSTNMLYFKTITPTTDGILPTVKPPLGTITTNIPDELTCTSDNLELDRIYVRSTAHPIYPLKKMQVFLDNGTLLKTKEFKKREHQYCYMMTVTAEEIAALNITIEELPFKVYLETSWYYFEHTIKHGFPQSSADENPDYWPNEKLDMKAEEFSLFRRQYRTDILPYEYIDTYPIGYPFTEEQDYWLEKRIAEEEATRTDANKVVYLYDTTGLIKLIELRSKIPGIHDIEIGTYENDLNEMRVKVTLSTRERSTLIEDYLFTDSISFMEDINNNSEILMAIYLNNATSLFLYNIDYIKSEGVYPTYGLVRSEIHSYLGVIPTIKDMSDYCLICDRKTWDNFVWSGDLFSPAVFRIDIPKPPSNFKWLTHDEIKTIIQRCKKVGTEVTSAYTTESQVKFGVSLESSAPEIYINKDFKLGIKLEMGDANVNLPLTMSARVTEMQVDQYLKDQTLNISLSTEVGMLSELFSEDTQDGFWGNAINTFYSTKVTGTGPEAYIELDNATTYSTNGRIAANLAQDIPRTGGTLGWTKLNTIAPNGGAVIGVTNKSGSNKSTRILRASNFNITNIPDTAIITGIAVTIAVNPGLSGSLPTAYCTMTAGTHVASETKSNSVPLNWTQVNFGNSTSMWGLNILGSDINQNKLKVDLYFNPVPNTHHIEVDWVAVYIYYRNGYGTFTTKRIVLA
jgi:hypothetical protein